MEENKIKKMLPAVLVFSFVAFCFAVANTFGNTYAYTSSDCPANWNYDTLNSRCYDPYVSSDLTACESKITNLGLTMDYSGTDDGLDLTKHDNYCLYSSGTKTYTAYVSVDDYAEAQKSKSCYVCISDVDKNAIWDSSTPDGASCLNGYWKKNDKVVLEKNCNVFSVTYNLNGGTLTAATPVRSGTENFYFGDTYTLPYVTKDGYNFLGWVSGSGATSSCDKTKISAGISQTVTSSTSWYACYEKESSGTTPSTTYTVTFNPNGGTFSDNSTSNKKTEVIMDEDEGTWTVTFPSVSKTGSTFNGWARNMGSGDACASSTKYKANTSVNITSDMSYIACWTENGSGTTPSTTYTATFYANDGSFTDYTAAEVTKECTYSNGKCYVSGFPNVTREGYTYNGYALNKNCTGDIYKNSIQLTDNNTKMYACWIQNSSGTTPTDPTDPTDPTPGTTYTATFDANGGTLNGEKTISCTTSNGATSCTIPDSNTYILPTAKLEGKTFTGWGTSKQCTKGNKSYLSLSADTTFYACYTDKEYTVTFNTNGGTLYISNKKSTTLTIEASVIDLEDYTAKRNNYTFTGWRTDSDSCKNAVKTGEITLDSSLKLHACFENESGSIGDNPDTGSTLLYIAYFVGILALCYTVYYTYRVVKSKR